MGNVMSMFFVGPKPNIASSTLGFGSIYFLSYWVFRNFPGFGLSKHQDALESSSRIASFIHSTTTSVWGLQRWQTPEGIHKSAENLNTEEQNMMIQYSVGYFLADLIYLLIFERDPMFLLHHVIALSMTAGSRFWAQGRGSAGSASMVGFFLGEVTTPLQNIWWLLKRSGNHKWANIVSIPYTLSFIIVRCILLPFYIIPVSVRMLKGTAVMRLQPVMARIWGVQYLVALLGGFLWSKSLITGFMKIMSKGQQVAPAR